MQDAEDAVAKVPHREPVLEAHDGDGPVRRMREVAPRVVLVNGLGEVEVEVGAGAELRELGVGVRGLVV